MKGHKNHGQVLLPGHNLWCYDKVNLSSQRHPWRVLLGSHGNANTQLFEPLSAHRSIALGRGMRAGRVGGLAAKLLENGYS